MNPHPGVMKAIADDRLRRLRAEAKKAGRIRRARQAKTR
jgi:hypothetical protein